MNQPANELYATWRHSHEEDEGDIEVYRPDSYQFPPARGRAGLSFAADGAFTEIPIGRDDRVVSRPGSWRSDTGTVETGVAEAGAADAVHPRLHITREHEMAPSESIEIVEVSSEVLKIRRLGQPGMW